MTHSKHKNPAASATSSTDDKSWQKLYDNIRTLAIVKSDGLVSAIEDTGAEPKSFDAGARTIRTLMSAAEITDRMKQAEKAERQAHERNPEDPMFTEEELQQIFEETEAEIDRLMERDARATREGEAERADQP